MKQVDVLTLELNFCEVTLTPSPFENFKGANPPELSLETQSSKGLLHALLAAIFQILLSI
jgi:hypothetical protein